VLKGSRSLLHFNHKLNTHSSSWKSCTEKVRETETPKMSAPKPTPSSSLRSPGHPRASLDFFTRQKNVPDWDHAEIEEQVPFVLGVGGIGNTCALALCRLGVKKMFLLDKDKVEARCVCVSVCVCVCVCVCMCVCVHAGVVDVCVRVMCYMCV